MSDPEKMTPEEFKKIFGTIHVEHDPEAEQREKRKEQESWVKRLKNSGIEKRFAHATFAEIEKAGVPEGIVPNYRKAKSYAEGFEKYFGKGVGIMFMGRVGRMKTTMAVAVAQNIMKKGYSAYFISMAELLDKMVSMSKNIDRTELYRFEGMISDTSLLILDDLGMEYPSDWVLNKVDAIITKRYNKMLPVIITTNLVPEEIGDRYMERIYDRLKSTSFVLIETGDSLRKEPKGGK